MHLKRLELVGFKSFAEKTVLEFPSGITGVVGPNGSGKSNIIDAVRWILGEREAKNMRGLKAEDLIFAGTEKRGRVSVAQAALVFDNTGRFFPVDYEEVSIRRRIERDGTAEYFLNDAEVRLKDVIDFFAQSRLGTKGFSIVNQGDSDLFVRSDPKERRAMLEEILGLRQFQLKKHDAELKLKNTKFNMEKAQALADEILPHLRLLRRQTAKWEKHGELEAELRELESQYFSFKINEIEGSEVDVEPKRKELESQISERRSELHELEAELKKVQSTAPKAGGDFEKWQKEKAELSLERAKCERELGRLEVQLEMLINQPPEEASAPEIVKMLEETRETIEDMLYENDLKRVKTLLKSLFEKINHLLDAEATPAVSKDRRNELESAKEDMSDELNELDKKLSSFIELEKGLNSGLKSFNDQFQKAFEAVQEKQKEVAVLESELQKILFEAERVRIKKEELHHEAERAGRRLQEFADTPAPTSFDSVNVERRILKLRGELAGIGEVDEGLIKEAKETEERHTFLTAQISDLEKAYKDLVTLIKELDHKIHDDFTKAVRSINEEFNNYFRMMFGGGQAKLVLQKREEPNDDNHDDDDRSSNDNHYENKNNNDNDHGDDEKEEQSGIEINVSIPRKRIAGLDMLSGGEKTLVSIAALFALISVSPPPFLVLDEIDAALDEANTRRFASLIKNFSKKTQFLLVTHNRATMEAADTLYGITMGDDGTSRVLSLKLEAEAVAAA